MEDYQKLEALRMNQNDHTRPLRQDEFEEIQRLANCFKPKFKKGDKVKMVKCGEALMFKDKEWICRGDSFKDKYNQFEVVFLENYAGWFWVEYLEKI